MKKILALLTVILLVPLSTLAQDFCQGNFDYDDNVDGSDASIFKTHFGRGSYENPCPPDGPAPVPQTGQTKCWNENGDEILCQTCIPGAGGCTNKTGQDGMWEKGVALPEPRFTVNGDGTVIDNLTGLIWMENASCFGDKTWQDALDECNVLSAGYCGLTDGSLEGDWRLPNRKELFSLLHDGYNSSPTLSNTVGTGQYTNGDPFTGVNSYRYWSSTTLSGSNIKSFAYYVSFESGEMYFSNKVDFSYNVWCVRGGQ